MSDTPKDGEYWIHSSDNDIQPFYTEGYLHVIKYSAYQQSTQRIAELEAQVGMLEDYMDFIANAKIEPVIGGFRVTAKEALAKLQQMRAEVKR